MKQVLLIIEKCLGFEAGWNRRIAHWVFSRTSMKASEKNRVESCCVQITTQLSVPLESQKICRHKGSSRVNRSSQNIGTRFPRIRAIFTPGAF